MPKVHAQEPGDEGEVDAEVDGLQVAPQRRQVLLQQALKHFSVGHAPLHRGDVVVDQDVFTDGRKRPERVLLRHHYQQHSRHKVHGLAVADGCVVQRVGGEELLELLLARLLIEVGVVGEGAPHIPLDLLGHRRVALGPPLQQALVDVGARLRFRVGALDGGTGNVVPHFASKERVPGMLKRNARGDQAAQLGGAHHVHVEAK
mmetsp:Transcript_4964/g.12351  ORF Transcript_4964/g.12351 Transcript_4964/m.12351 type:complete len:203 (+) Transcript_4964:681-1289(+)